MAKSKKEIKDPGANGNSKKINKKTKDPELTGQAWEHGKGIKCGKDESKKETE